MPEKIVTLHDGAGASAVVAPDLGAWLLRYTRVLPAHGPVEAIHFSQEVVDRYPNQMYAGNPLLFPQVSFSHLPGREHHYRWQEGVYALPQHGFARRSRWRIAEQTESSLTMELSSSPETLAAYPFPFRATAAYRLRHGSLIFHQTVENRGETVLPFSTGIHPYLPVPIGARGQRNQCHVELPACDAITTPDNWQTWTAMPQPALNLPVARDASGTFFFGNLAKPILSLVDPASRLRIVLDMSGAPSHRYVALWSNSGSAPFYCLEPWTALPNSLNRQNSELIQLKPKETFEASIAMRVEPFE